jgi:asparagine synthase (glutamine-hydrolysing)
MGAICGYCGTGDAVLLRRMGALLRHRGRGGAARDVHGSVGLMGAADAGHAAEIGRVGGVRCALEGTLFGVPALAEELGLDPRAGAAAVVAHGFKKHGPRFFERLDGAFVVAVADGDELHLARDPLGEKPLYFTRLGDTLLFASEIKAFFGHAGFVATPNQRSLVKLLVFSFIPGTDSMFEGVHELPPGKRAVIRPGAEPEITTYWDLSESESDDDEAFYVERIRALVDKAVGKRLGDRKRVGAFLSGGIDSSAVVALLARAGAHVTAFSAGFGHGQPNELMYARLVAEHCNVEHRVIDIEPDGFIDLLPGIMWQLDDPLCDCITVPNYVLAREAARDVDVVFNGEGGDPLFGGPKNKFLILGEWYAFLGGHDRARAYLSSYHKLYDHLGALCAPELLRATGGAEPLEELVRPYLENPSIRHFLNRLMHVNIKLKGGQNILVKVDKMLSANGVHAASPLFDRELTEFSFAIPPRFKRRGDVEKYVFKKAVEDALPRAVVYRKKAGMGVPLNHWFKFTKLRDVAGDLLGSSRWRARGYFKPKFVDDLLGGKAPENHVGQNRSGELLWMLLAIELWHRVFVDGERPA